MGRHPARVGACRTLRRPPNVTCRPIPFLELSATSIGCFVFRLRHGLETARPVGAGFGKGGDLLRVGMSANAATMTEAQKANE